MKSITKIAGICLLLNHLFLFTACRTQTGEAQNNATVTAVNETAQNSASPESNNPPSNYQTPQLPNLQAEILDEQNRTTNAPIGKIDFKNYTYPLPRGWQGAGGITEITLENGKAPVSKEEEKIGASLVGTKFGDATGDGVDEAFVVLKIETGGSAIPQVVYVLTMKEEEPELIWHFRTGDRADGGLKNIRAENSEIVVELFGQDRFILGEIETMKIEGDEEQLCCPSHFTRSRYKWNGTEFLMQGKRRTYEVGNENAPPQENKGELVEKEKAASKR